MCVFSVYVFCVYVVDAWRGGRAAEGAPLLREYRVKSSIEGSNPSLSATLHCAHVILCIRILRIHDTAHTRDILKTYAPVAQLDRAADYGSAGLGFESSQVHHTNDSERGRFPLK